MRDPKVGQSQGIFVGIVYAVPQPGESFIKVKGVLKWITQLPLLYCKGHVAYQKGS